MAYVKILNIRSPKGINNAVKYVEDDEKTDIAKRDNKPVMVKEEEGIGVGVENADIDSAISNLVNYTTDGEKTEEQLLVSGINCTTHHAAEEMQSLVDYWKEKRRITGVSRDAFHIIQSFDPKDNEKLTPEMAHEIGMKYAEELTHMDDKHNVNRKYMMLLSTHVDREHLHNHIILCSYDMDTGRKFHECKEVYRQMKAASDKLCQEYGLSVIEEPDLDRKYSRKEYDEAKKGTSWKDNVRKDIDAMKSISSNWDEFKTYMTSIGYEIKEGKYVTYTTPDDHKVRDKTLGKEWTKEEIEKSWQQEQVINQSKGKKKKDKGIERFYKDQEQNKDQSGGYYYDSDLYKSPLGQILAMALELMQEPDNFQGQLYFSGMHQVPTPEKEKEYRVKRIQNTIELAKSAGVSSEEELQARLDKPGADLSHARLQRKKTQNSINKMEVISNAITEVESVQDVMDEINNAPEEAIKKDLQDKYKPEIETYRQSMKVLYRYKCSTPEQINDFKIRFEKAYMSLASYDNQIKELRKEYKTLMKIKYGMELAQDEGFVTGKYYDDPEKTESERQSGQPELSEKDKEQSR